LLGCRKLIFTELLFIGYFLIIRENVHPQALISAPSLVAEAILSPQSQATLSDMYGNSIILVV